MSHRSPYIYSLPRMRGDRPSKLSCPASAGMFTPHARGSTLQALGPNPLERVYPACAGIDLKRASLDHRIACLPRMRGDRPRDRCVCRDLVLFTPHARGSTVGALGALYHCPVYPACAGIDRAETIKAIQEYCLPRMRGDRPRCD